MARVSRAELKRLIDKVPDSELEGARQALQALIDAAADQPDAIQDRLRAQESAGATAEREWQESETDNRGRSQQG